MKENSIIKRLQASNMVGCAMKTVTPDKIVFIIIFILS